MPAELSPHRMGRRLLELAAVVVVVVVAVWVGPDLGGLRRHIENAAPGWLLAGVGLEVLSALAYVVVFRSVFCQRMSWRLSYQIGMSEQAANSVLSVSGAGGLALGVWALRRGGMSVEHIGRRTVAFFLLTSLANVGGVVLFAVLYAVGLLGHNPNPPLIYGFGAAAAVAIVLVVGLPALIKPARAAPVLDQDASKTRRAIVYLRFSLVQGTRDAVFLLRQRSPGVIGGSVGTMAFDLAVLGVCFHAFGGSPALGVVVMGYLIGQLGGNLPVPGGIGGVDGGLIGTFALFHQPLAVTTAAVLVYHAISLWIPAVLGSVAFVQLRRTLEREEQPAAMCGPLAEPLERPKESAAAG